MKKRSRKENSEIRRAPGSEDDFYGEKLRDEIIKPRSKNSGPVPLDMDSNDHEHEAEELERQGYTDNGLANPPYTNEESAPEEPDPKAPKQWKIA